MKEPDALCRLSSLRHAIPRHARDSTTQYSHRRRHFERRTSDKRTRDDRSQESVLVERPGDGGCLACRVSRDVSNTEQTVDGRINLCA